MFFEGAHRLLESGVSVVPCRPTGSDRVAVEAYPALAARHWVEKQGYKNDKPGKQTPEQREARQKIMYGLTHGAVKYYGIEVLIEDRATQEMVDDPTGDTMDGLLCALQAAHAYLERNDGWGIPDDIDVSEGWIAGESK